MRFRSCSLALAALLAFTAAARADTFNFSAVGTGVNFAGTLTATSNGDGSFSITNVTGNGLTYVARNSDSTGDNDNLLFPKATRLLDESGFSFNAVLAGITYNVNIFSSLGFNPPTNVIFYADTLDTNGNFTDTPVSFTAATAVTPEPSSLLLFTTGLAALTAFQFRKRLSF